MTEQKPLPIGGITQMTRDLKSHLSLFWSVFRDPRVSKLLKLGWVFATLLYWVLPDLMPGLPYDDIGATLLFTYVFVGLAPKKVVEEYREGKFREM